MKHSLRAVAGVLSLALVLVGCDAASPSRAPSPSASAAGASPVLTEPSSEPTPTPPPDPAIGWVSPATDRIKDYTSDLAVTTAAANIRRVVFTVTWKNGSKTACTSAKPDSRGRWACSANLLKVGVAPGSIDLAAQAFNTNEQAIKGASDVRSLTYAVVPPRPGSVAMKVLSDDWADDDTHTEVDSFTWTAPKGYANEFRLYGVTGCPNASSKTESEPCLVEHTSLDASEMKLLKKVGASARSMKLRTVVAPGKCAEGFFCSPYRSLVLGAFNAYGQSVYAIVATQVNEECYECEGP
jgi:hypothetical protein